MDHKTSGLRATVNAAIWNVSLSSMPSWKVFIVQPIRLLIVLARDLAYGQLTLRAMGLVYTTMLSLVPLLALSFSVLKAFGVYNRIDTLLLGFLAPLGARSTEVTRWIIKFIENLNVGVLSSLGLALLIYTVVTLIQKIEESLNFIWHISRLRNFARRFSGYLSVLLVGPVLIFAAVGIASGIITTMPAQQILAIAPLGGIAYAAGKTIPFLMLIGLFTFIYVFGPNTKVKIEAALVGGAVAAALWQGAGWMFTEFASKSTQYAAIYSSFAILLLFFIWLYVNWLILLLGASIAFYHQHPEYLILRSGEPRLSNRMRERVGVMAMFLIGKAYRDGPFPCSFESLIKRLGVPMHSLEIVLAALIEHGLLIQPGEDLAIYLPARELETITLPEILEAVRTAGEELSLNTDSLEAPVEVMQVFEQLDKAAGERLKALTLKDLVAYKLPCDAGNQSIVR
ncbi:MAG: YihY family inner membrane protein [Propionivibrio sp.]|uniref:YihY family inner membrane protein n=1 Tax=Candidatus Propionivibrio dominans TaxID=2954373 RepID=A0A9D7F8D9_9RHOO|nr:YihY family inner membrane protein [Candidatus Propionivibrio dominans]